MHSAPLPAQDRPLSRQTAGFRRRLVEPWRYEWSPVDGVTHQVRIPAGVEYNPTAPGVTSPLVPMSRMQVASLPHDVIYVLQGRVGRLVRYKVCEGHWASVGQVSRRYADRLFYHLMREVGTARWRAVLAYVGVRVGGPFYWHENDPKQIDHIQDQMRGSYDHSL